jgi:hypothetical protein
MMTREHATPADEPLPCIFCGKPAGEDSISDDNGATACRKCGEAEIEAQIAEGLRRRTTMDEKPLFIPLKTEWYRQFEAGTKDTEYRAYGPRWNERTCRVGRKAVLSLGYSSGKRLERTVSSFKVLDHAEAPEAARTIYPGAAFIAAIQLS